MNVLRAVKYETVFLRVFIVLTFCIVLWNLCAEIKLFLTDVILKISFFFFFSRIFDDHEAFTAPINICKESYFNKYKYSQF